MDVKSFLGKINRFNGRIGDQGGGYLYYWSSLIWCAIRFGSSFDDYFRYEFCKKSDKERNKFITYRRSKMLIKLYNNPNNVSTVLDKRLFNKHFAKYVKRGWLDTNTCSFDEFSQFIKKHKSVIVKPVDLGSGMGIWKLEGYKQSKDEIESTFFKIKGALVEEIINQHRVLDSLNESSINTVRVLTFWDSQKPQIVGTCLRMGVNGSVVDNLHSGGLCAEIDINKGIVFTMAVDSKLKKYILHPNSGEKIIGLEIPNWDKLINTAKKAALLLPELKYLGWDFAILNDDVELIEANHDPAHDLSQIADQNGKYQIINNLIP